MEFHRQITACRLRRILNKDMAVLRMMLGGLSPAIAQRVAPPNAAMPVAPLQLSAQGFIESFVIVR